MSYSDFDKHNNFPEQHYVSWRPESGTVPTSWWQSPTVLAAVQYHATGDPGRSEIDWLKERTGGRCFRHALVLCCGGGRRERALIERGMIERATCIDVDPEAARTAKQEAQKIGIDELLDYIVADANTWPIPENTFDLILSASALHHLERLEDIIERIHTGLTSDGLFFLFEYVGPNRFQFTQKHLIHANRVLYALSPEHRRVTLQANKPKEVLVRPCPEDIARNDPTEAIRAEEILPLIDSSGLETIDKVGQGGGIYFALLGGMVGSFDENLSHDTAVLRILCELDTILTEQRILPNLRAMVLASREPVVGLQPVLRTPRQVSGEIVSIPVDDHWSADTIVESHLRRVALGDASLTWAEWFRRRYLSEPVARCCVAGQDVNCDEWKRANVAREVCFAGLETVGNGIPDCELIVTHQPGPFPDGFDGMLDAMLGRLNPQGLLFLIADIGPGLHIWTAEVLETVNRLLGVLPENRRKQGQQTIARILGPELRAKKASRLRLDGHSLHTIEARPAGGGIILPFLSAVHSCLDDTEGKEILRLICAADEILTRERKIPPVRVVSVLSPVVRPDLKPSPVATVVCEISDGKHIGINYDVRVTSGDEAVRLYSSLHGAKDEQD